MATVLEKTHDESAKSPDFFQDNNAIKKKFFLSLYIFFFKYFIRWYQHKNLLYPKVAETMELYSGR